MIGIRALAAAGALPGCATATPGLAPLESRVVATEAGASVAVVGLIRDVDPSVRRALPIADSAVLQRTGSPAEGFFEFETVDLRGAPGLVRVDFPKSDGSLAALREPRQMRITVRAGHSAREGDDRRLVERIARELLTFARER